jgi:hypothetical protein
MPAQAAVWSGCETSADLAVEAVALPVLHGDVARERVQQVDVAPGVVDGFPVVPRDIDDLEQPAGLDLAAVVSQLLRAWQRGVGRTGLADLVMMSWSSSKKGSPS